METGTVKWFDGAKGYGFIRPDAGGGDVFLHSSAVARAGLSTVNQGQKVGYDAISERGKPSVYNLRLQSQA